MKWYKYRGQWLCLLVVLLVSVASHAQGFVNLTAKQVRIGTDLPLYTTSLPLPQNYSDSIYTVAIGYPEYIDVHKADQMLLAEAGIESLPAMPEITTYVSQDRGKGVLDVSFLPFVQIDGTFRKLVSFKLLVTSAPRHKGNKQRAADDNSRADRYASHSVLRTGKWAKIRVPHTGVFELTQALIRQAGFNDLSRVAVYGYGGAMQPETLSGDYLASTDDLKPVDLYEQDGRRFFYGKGSVSYPNNASAPRVRNPYSDYGYYLITEHGKAVETKPAADFLALEPGYERYHSLYEVDGFAWYEGGRNLYDPTTVAAGRQQTVTLPVPQGVTRASLTISTTTENQTVVNVGINGKMAGSLTTTKRGDYDHSSSGMQTFSLEVEDLQASNTITIVPESATMHLDFVQLSFDKPFPLSDITAEASVPEYVYNITNQDHHADAASDMVIIIPASGKLWEQARRIKDLHEKHDGMTVQIVPADELFNEFASGTPDANAYRRYLKMMYDRTDCAKPSHLLLMGDGLWDNRMLTPSTRRNSADDYLLCYESENSTSSTDCFVDDGWFCLLDDGEGGAPKMNKPDVAVGRFPVTTEADARVMTDKAIDIATNSEAGSWQTRVILLADDGIDKDSSPFVHIKQAESIAQNIETRFPGIYAKRYYWNAYPRVTAASGNSYPAVTTALQQEMRNGALIFNYVGHGIADAMSHEYVLRLNDFTVNSRKRTSLWVTASCDIMPYDGTIPTIGETAVLNPEGCAHSFFGTTRTVYSGYNEKINTRFMNYALQTDPAGRMLYTIGESVRRTKVDLVELGEDLQANKLQYTLLGDPALRLAIPADSIAVDYINDISTSSDVKPQLKAGGLCTIKGRVICRATGETMKDFNGSVETGVRDSKQTLVCTDKNGSGATWTYQERPVTLYSGSDAVKNGEFTVTFRLPAEISYSNLEGQIQMFAINDERTVTALGENEHFIVGGSELGENNGVGPAIYCYLNEPDFSNGDDVNTTPYFYATVSDPDGINVSGSGIGHDMVLSIDDVPAYTYTLNNYFALDFGSYTDGKVGFSIPTLSAGRHKLKFRCFDVFNNSNTVQLDFNVVEGMNPRLKWVSCLQNPASTSTTFLVSHNRSGSTLDLTLQVFDMAGRKVYEHTTTDVPDSPNSTLTWDLTSSDGSALSTGVYLYRVIAGDKQNIKSSKSEKIIIIR